MIFFPAPYEDEILYSILARYSILNDSILRETIVRELYGKNIIYSNIDLPFAISRLVSNLPLFSKINEESIIYNNTLYPFYSAFLSKSNSQFIYNSMVGDIGSQINLKSGQANSNIKKNDYLRFCPQCFIQDMSNRGQSFWRRQHQIPSMIVCGNHRCFLQDSLVQNGKDTKTGFISPNEENCIIDRNCFDKFIEIYSQSHKCVDEENIKQDIMDKSLHLLKNIDFLLSNRVEYQNIEFFIYKYIDALREKKLTNSAGFAYLKKIQNEFMKYYGEAFLTLTQSMYSVDNTCNWLYLFLRRNKGIRHPIRHILFSMFLGIELKDLFDKDLKSKGIMISNIKHEPRRKKDEVRQQWLKLMKDNPKATRTELQILDNGTYIWLLRHDKEWYHNVARKRKKMIVPKDKKDWAKIDNEVALYVEKEIEEIKNNENKPVRITKGYILRMISDKIKIYDTKKLPLTQNKIDLFSESFDGYRDRKMRWAIKKLLDDGENITMWKVIRKMGIGVNISKELKENVIRSIDNLLKN